MPAPFSQVIFSGPTPGAHSQWQTYVKEEFFPSQTSGKSSSRGILYEIIQNPMGRAPPDDSTSLAILESDSSQCLQSDDLRTVAQHSASPVDSRSYEFIELFDPLGLGAVVENPAPFILQAEADPAEIAEYIEFYREDHAPMMAKHPGYLYTALYRLKGIQKEQQSVPAPLMIIHGFRNIEGLGSQITKDSIETEFAKRVFPKVKSMKARMMKLVHPRDY